MSAQNFSQFWMKKFSDICFQKITEIDREVYRWSWTNWETPETDSSLLELVST
jgi:hypothetical protein